MPLPLPDIKQQLEQLNKLMLVEQQRFGHLLENVHPAQSASAFNLLHYLVLRSKDVRDLQDALHENGFSSLTNSESHVRSQILAILHHFDTYTGNGALDNNSSKRLLQKRAGALFGATADHSLPAIMVTLKTSHAHDYLALKKLLR